MDNSDEAGGDDANHEAMLNNVAADRHRNRGLSLMRKGKESG